MLVDREYTAMIRNQSAGFIRSTLDREPASSGRYVLAFVLLFLAGQTGWSQTTVTGTIRDAATGEPLIGASIQVPETSTGSVTDYDGNYTLTLPAGTSRLLVSYTGYASREISLATGQTVADVNLDSGELLDEVVVIGYGTTKKSDLTGSVASIDVEDIENIPTARVDQILQGRTAGVNITQTNGSPGAGTVIRIRGGNSIIGSNEPLWVIDGIIVGQNFDLNNLNSNDISSIEILKDASSIAIYGSRGANGVILVTTKGGKSFVTDKPRINLAISRGVQGVLDRPEYMNGPEHVAYANEDARFRQTAEPFPDPTGLPDNDFVDLLTRNAPITNATASIAGNSEGGDINFYLSGNFFDQRGIIETSGIRKYIYRSNLDVDLTERLSAGVRINYARLAEDNGLTSWSQLIGLIPEFEIYNADGTFNGINNLTGSPTGNPVANVRLNTNETFTNNLLGTVYLQYQPSDKWLLRTTYNPEINNVKTNTFNSSQRPDFLSVGDRGDASVRNFSSLGWNNENTVQYTTDLGERHNISLLGGASFQRYEAESNLAQAFGITSDATRFNNLALGSDPTRNTIGSDYDAFQIVSFFGRINYGYQNRYLLTLVGRTDGSSRFAPGNKYAFFPSVAAAWKISQEPFMQNQRVLSDLKLRASYGKSGSQAIESFRTFSVLDNAPTTYNGVLFPGVSLGRPANEDLKWETTTQLDIALETSILNGRFYAEINWYRKVTQDLLLEVRIPQSTGFTGRLQNLGEIENKGLELYLTSNNITSPVFNWSSTLTLSGNRNKVLDLGGVEFIDVIRSQTISGPEGRLIVGQPAPVFIGVNYLGTWKNQEDIDASGLVNQTVGGPRFDDTNGDGVIAIDDYYILGSPQPDYIFGLQNTLAYKGLEFSFFLQGTQGNEVYNGRTQTSFFQRGEALKYKEVVNRWTPQNPDSDIPRAGSDFALDFIPNNSEAVEDGSHVRLKTVRLAYHLPVQQLGWGAFQDLTVYATGTNVLLWSDFRLIDPETSNFGRDNLAQGFAGGEYPTARTIVAGLNVTF